MSAYDDAAAAIRIPLSMDASRRDLVRYATLAANSHNTQPWKFRVGPSAIDVLPDLDRRTPVVDPDDHHLYCTLGCATENLVIAGAARGFAGTPTFVAGMDGGGQINVTLTPAPARETPAFKAIPERGVSRAVYDGKPLPVDTVAALEAAARSEAVEAIMITEPARIETILALVVEGNNLQFTDPAFMNELKRWIRFDARQAIETGDGLFAGCTGNPSVPPWLGRLIFGFVASPKAEAEKYAAQIRSSAGIMVLVGREADPEHWAECGRSYQRFALTATTLGLRHAFINQAVEVPAVREKLAAELGIAGRRPDLIVRFGNGPAMPRSLRRLVSEVLV
ncbi:MAG TPA: Tat pathway signal protein [Bauldia sp.]|nr:Tat pathway signal protein [Bauldia sp.]